MQTFTNIFEIGYGLNDSQALSFGDLRFLGHLTKDYQCDYQGNVVSIEWVVVGDIEFTTERGEKFVKGDRISWEK